MFEDYSIGDNDYNYILMLIKKIMDSGRIDEVTISNTIEQLATRINRAHKILEENKKTSNVEDRIRLNVLIKIFMGMFHHKYKDLDPGVYKPSKL